MKVKPELVIIKELTSQMSEKKQSRTTLRVIRWKVNNIYMAPRIERRSFVLYKDEWRMRKMVSLGIKDVEYIADHVQEIRDLMKMVPDDKEPIFK